MRFGWMGITNGNEKKTSLTGGIVVQKSKLNLLSGSELSFEDERKMPNSLGTTIFIYCPSPSTLDSAWSLLHIQLLLDHIAFLINFLRYF